MNWLLVRAVAAFLALPGVVAFMVPLLLAPGFPSALDGLVIAGVALVGMGTGLLLACVREFYVAGRGTLAPWSPPVHLVQSGLYRFSRNPMYVAVQAIVWGWALLFWSPRLAVYAAAVALLFIGRVVGFEEPLLERRFGDEWRRYKARVPRWML